ncbi:MAG: hypothetical protein SAJ11_20725, partial [Jaaginema sp. PMC 1078.18]|nr:hypothetical protein [Jaaginema sp. PMC 1078.18]
MKNRKILIATKTYPSISTKYKETVCTAGILLDEDENPLQWIRIYPIKFRYLETDQKFKRWSIINAEIDKNTQDYRLESFRINDSSIQFVRQLSTQNNWAEIKKYVLHLEFDSTQDIQRQGKSLGIIKPKSIERYFHRATEREWKVQQQAVLDQLDLFEQPLPLDKIPYKFYYQFTDKEDISHQYSISDWEISQLYRNCLRRASGFSIEEKERNALEKVRQKLADYFLNKKDLYFIIGNLKNDKN